VSDGEVVFFGYFGSYYLA